MRISAPRKIASPGRPDRIRLEAAVSYDGWLARPEHVWFDFPFDLEAELSQGGDPWLTALLPLAFALGEGIELETAVSRDKIENSKQLMAIWSDWYPQLSPVSMDAILGRNADMRGSAKVGSFFSGGVDSFFTVLHDRDASGGTIDELIMIQGADLPLDNEIAFQRAHDMAARVAAVWGLRLITVATNMRQTRFEEANYELLGTGPLLAAVGLMLGPRYRKLFISSTWSGEALHPMGTHPDTDPLLSNASTTFVHYGEWADRIPKTEYIAGNTLALSNLRVCWEGDSGGNCGRCLKCLRTMAALEILGVLEEAPAFAGTQLDLDLLRRQVFTRDWRYYQHLLRFAHDRGREDIASAIEAAFARTERLHRLMFLGLVPQARQRTRLNPTWRRLARPVYHWLRRIGVWLNRHLP